MSRFARSYKDWHHLLEVCAIFGTLPADQDGVHDPGDSNDRLLLGLKGTMSEVELHLLESYCVMTECAWVERINNNGLVIEQPAILLTMWHYLLGWYSAMIQQ